MWSSCPDYEQLPEDFKEKYNWECLINDVEIKSDGYYIVNCKCFSTGVKD